MRTKEGVNASHGTEVCIIQKHVWAQEKSSHIPLDIHRADFHSPGRLSLPSTQNPEQDSIPAKHNLSLCVLTEAKSVVLSSPNIHIPAVNVLYFIFLPSGGTVTQNLIDFIPLCFAILGCSKKDEREGIMWTSTHARTHAQARTHSPVGSRDQ